MDRQSPNLLDNFSHPLETFILSHGTRQSHVCRQQQVLLHCQFLVVRDGQLEDIPSVLDVPVVHQVGRNAIDEDLTLREETVLEGCISLIH